MVRLSVYEREAMQDATRDRFRWRLQAFNGRIIADSGEAYQTRAGAERAARKLVTALRGRVKVFTGRTDKRGPVAFFVPSVDEQMGER